MSDNAAAIEKANSYRMMMELWAWKDFQKFLNDERSLALESLLMKESDIDRGRVRQIDSIKAQLAYIVSDPI